MVILKAVNLISGSIAMPHQRALADNSYTISKYVYEKNEIKHILMISDSGI